MGRGIGKPWVLLCANLSLPAHRCENQELRRMVMLSSQDSGKREAAEQQQVRRQHHPPRRLGRRQEAH